MRSHELSNAVFFLPAVILCAMAGLDVAQEAEEVAESTESPVACEILEGDAAHIVSLVSEQTGVKITRDEESLAGKTLRVECDRGSTTRTLRALALALESVDLVLLQQGDAMRVEKFTRVSESPRVLVVAVSEGSVEVVGAGAPQEIKRGEKVLVNDNGICSRPARTKPEEIAAWRWETERAPASKALAATINAPVHIRLIGTTAGRNLPIIECGVEKSARSLMFGSKELKAEVLEVSPKNVVIDEEQGEMQITLRVRIGVQ